MKNTFIEGKMNRKHQEISQYMQTCRTREGKSDRAVSEAIGFIIIFGIIISGIGLVTLYGYPMLLQQQSSSDEQIMEKNLIVLQNDIKSLAYKTVPYKETSLKVGGGALTTYNMTYDNASSSYFSVYSDNSNLSACIINGDGTCATSLSNALTFHSGDLRYESTSAQTEMSLENGAVVKRMLAQDGSTMLAEPRWFYDSTTNTVVIYLIGFNITDTMAQTGIGTVKMELNLDPTRTYSSQYNLEAGQNIYVNYTYPDTIPNANPDYSNAWNMYFQNTLKMSGSGPYEFPIDTTRPATLVINRYEIFIKSV